VTVVLCSSLCKISDDPNETYYARSQRIRLLSETLAKVSCCTLRERQTLALLYHIELMIRKDGWQTDSKIPSRVRTTTSLQRKVERQSSGQSSM